MKKTPVFSGPKPDRTHEPASKRHPGEFKLRRAGFKGKGLRPRLQHASWYEILEMIYEPKAPY